MDRLKAKKKMFEEMGEFADGAHADELRAKYAPEPEVEEVPGTEETGEGEMSEEGMMPEEDVEALLAQLTPEQLEELFSK
jgi:hypothetical protein